MIWFKFQNFSQLFLKRWVHSFHPSSTDFFSIVESFLWVRLVFFWPSKMSSSALEILTSHQNSRVKPNFFCRIQTMKYFAIKVFVRLFKRDGKTKLFWITNYIIWHKEKKVRKTSLTFRNHKLTHRVLENVWFVGKINEVIP
jgi:hypothetical protein